MSTFVSCESATAKRSQADCLVMFSAAPILLQERPRPRARLTHLRSSPLTCLNSRDCGERRCPQRVDLAAFLVLGLPIGVWVDRMRKRRILIGADLVRTVAVSSLPFAYFLGELSIWHLFVGAWSSERQTSSSASHRAPCFRDWSTRNSSKR